MALKAICVSAMFACLTSGCLIYICETCIPLEDLLAPGYAISVSPNGLSSAVAYHNGTLATLGSTVGSKEYRALISGIFNEYHTVDPPWTPPNCVERAWRPLPKPWDKDIFKLMRYYARDIMGKIQRVFETPKTPEPTPPLDPMTQMIQTQMLALEPFASMSIESRSRAVVAVQLPPWLVPSPYSCWFRSAADATFGRVLGPLSAPSSTYAALGYEIRGMDAMEDVEQLAPGRLAVFEYDGHLATASMMVTPAAYHGYRDAVYKTLESRKPAELSKWINSFLDATSPDFIALAGSDVDSGIFQEAYNLSNAAGKAVPGNPDVASEDLIVKGAAQLAKDVLENHPSYGPMEQDCDEESECRDIRREADRIAGRYSFHKPDVWAAYNKRHWREFYEEAETVQMGNPGFASTDLPVIISQQ